MRFSPEIAIDASRIVYYSTMLKTEKLLNHSINLRTIYLDSMHNPIGGSVVNQEGLTGTTNWIRFVEFEPAPAEAAYYCIVFWAYPNGRRPSRESGLAYFAAPRIER